MTNMQPVWLLDVDGVINAVHSSPDRSVWPASAWTRHEATVDGNVWPILTASTVLEFIRRVHESGAAEIRWHTTWQHDAPNILAPLLNLPALPVQDANPGTALTGPSRSGTGYMSNDWWKAPAARSVLAEEGRPLIWTDDDITFYGHNVSVSASVLGLPSTPRSLLISPQVRLGLTRKHLKQIAEFIGRADLLVE